MKKELCLDVGFAHTYVHNFLKHVVFASNHISCIKASKTCRHNINRTRIAYMCVKMFSIFYQNKRLETVGYFSHNILQIS